MSDKPKDLYMCENRGCGDECSHYEVDLYKGANGEPVCEDCFAQEPNELWERRESWKSPKTLEIKQLRAENDELKKAGEWQPIDSAPKDGGQFMAIVEGWHYWSKPDISGFASGCDMGPDTGETYHKARVAMVWFTDGIFIDEIGYQYGINGVNLDMHDEDEDGPIDPEIEFDNGRKALRLTHCKPLPSTPK